MDAYCPRRADIVWLTFNPQAGHEQAGRRPALVLSPESYNRKTNLAVFCPITSQEKGYPFEVPLPKGRKISGVILSDQIKSLDWKVRNTKFCCRIDARTMSKVMGILGALLVMDNSNENTA